MLVLEFLELLLGEGLFTSLLFETAAFMAVGGSIHVEKVVLLSKALVFIVVIFGVHASWLETSSKAIELGGRTVTIILSNWQSCGGSR